MSNATYVVQASPLTRIFLPEWHDKCLADPQLLLSPQPFKIRVPRPSGSVELVHNQPTLAASLLTRTQERQVTEDEVSPLVRWLTEDDEFETDCWGIVAVPIQDNVADAIMALMTIDGDDKKRLKLLEETRKQMAKGIQSARARADARVMRACGKIYSVVKSTVEDMKKNGKGVYAPSYAEALAFEVMKDTISKRRQPDERAAELMRGALDQMQQPV